MSGVLVAAFLIGIPAAAFTLWPLWTRRGLTLLPLAPDLREQLFEDKRQALRSLRELAFEHQAGHISEDDYAELCARYEREAATVLTELDRLGDAPVEPSAPAPSNRRSGWRHPLALGASAAALLAFGVGLGAGIVRYATPEPPTGTAMPGSRPLAPLEPMPRGDGTGTRTLSPEMLRGMLQAARASLSEGRYDEAIAAYQAILKRDPKNVDAMTHLGLIVAIGGHADAALETFDKALAIDPNYPPALLYRGQVLYESKRDVIGAIRTWEKFLAVTPPGDDRDRVAKMIADAKAASK